MSLICPFMSMMKTGENKSPCKEHLCQLWVQTTERDGNCAITMAGLAALGSLHAAEEQRMTHIEIPDAPPRMPARKPGGRRR